MKKIIFAISLITLTTLTGCFDIINETVINEDGSGVYSNTTNMGSLINLLMMMGAENQLKEMENTNQDTTISLAYLKDSLANLTDLEKTLAENATLRIRFNLSEEIMLMTITVPYKKQSDMVAVSHIISEANKNIFDRELEKAISGLSTEEQMAMGNSNNSLPDLNEYYDHKFENGKMSKKLNKTKYATISEDQLFKNMREMGQFGSPMTLKTVFNLPRPVKKADGIGVKISEDRKKIIIEASLDDFFESPEKLEYEIEY